MNSRYIMNLALVCMISAPLSVLQAAVVSDVAQTPHNLSSTGGPNVMATTETQICVFCHTPHGANSAAPGPLWNRSLSTTADADYTTYSSESTDATIGAPGGSSKLCLSCHDGAMTLGKVNVLNGATDVTVTMQNSVTAMPVGTGSATGFTRNLGVDLSNDHPISFDYDVNLTTADTELYPLTAVTHIAERDPGVSPAVPLENGKVQCTSCHDPHLWDDSGKNIKFLRLNRFQEAGAPTDGSFDTTNYNDIVCLACHDKEGWGNSAHAHPNAAGETYTDAAANQRDFFTGIQVWEAACLNCHDTHTVQGARRLLREGTDGALVTDSTTGEGVRSGGAPALENTCYQCHDAQANTILTATDNQVPDIKSDFGLTYRMPITTGDQNATSEVHAIGTGTDGQEGTNRGQDFVEARDNLGRDAQNSTNRHAECTDCHNPHRVKKNRLFNATGAPGAAGTHTHEDGTMHTNIASGVLSGITGVEPIYGSTTWGNADANITYTLKRGAAGVSTDVTSTYVTREYQVCLKCHTNYAWPDGQPPTIGPSIGINNVNQYTNQAMEFHAPVADQGTEAVTGADHSSWHPVMAATGRTASSRAMDAAAANQPFLAPWNDNGGTHIGNQTMYCSDCHGSNVTSTSSVIPDGGDAPGGTAWGPHGSTNSFILKGQWDGTSGNATSNALCFKCHNYNDYGLAGSTPNLSGFRVAAGTANNQCNTTTNKEVNLHIGHLDTIGSIQCTWCHTAVPHGWQNKALLVDYQTDLTPGKASTINADAGSPCGPSQAGGCTIGPYYLGAQLGGGGAVIWKTSGNWTAGDCGGLNWMNGGGAGAGAGAGGGCPY